MKTITITFSVNDRELELLRLGKCDKPNPQRLKLQMLSEAAGNLRRMSEVVIHEARGQAIRKPARGRDDRAERKRKPAPLLTSRTNEEKLARIGKVAAEKPKRVPHQGKTLLVYGDEQDSLPVRRPYDDGKVN